MKRMTLPFVLGLAIFVTACDDDTGEAALEAARARWERNQPSHDVYQFTTGAICFCSDTSDVRISVRHGVVEGAVHVADHTPVDEAQRSQLETIDDLFDTIEELRQTADKVTASYDPTLGYPTIIKINFAGESSEDYGSIHVGDLTLGEP